MAEIESGSITLFRNSSALVGWTKLTTDTDCALRVVSGTTSSGGTVGFTTCYGLTALGGTVGSSSASFGSTTLTADQIPSHQHNILDLGILPGTNRISHPGPQQSVVDPNPLGSNHRYDAISPLTDRSINTGSVGGSAHTHPIVVNYSNPLQIELDLRIKYVDMILAQRDPE